jgi:hypothetical protein
MDAAAILLTVEATYDAESKIQSAQVSTSYLVKVDGKGCGRGRFVEARGFLTPWRFQAQKFETRAEAEAIAEILDAAEGQSVSVVTWDEPWHEELPDHCWDSDPKIALVMADGNRPLLELVRIYATALEAKLHLAHIMPAALAFLGPHRALDPAVRRAARPETVDQALHAWRRRL